MHAPISQALQVPHVPAGYVHSSDPGHPLMPKVPESLATNPFMPAIDTSKLDLQNLGFFGNQDPFGNGTFFANVETDADDLFSGRPFEKPFFSQPWGDWRVQGWPKTHWNWNWNWFNQPQQHGWSQTKTPSSWSQFMPQDNSNQNGVFTNTDHTQMAMNGTMVAGNGQHMEFNGNGLNGQGAQVNHFKNIVADQGSTVTFGLLLI
mmetsp:Transcript_35826/g.54914  ORF Transcript_35826/g.54914 Transcript_35826/m.54914 type:complete len:205 (-) Transcript_35826:40-654(-)|eukprot:CAMPEP_0170489406 /NCGR_PEP_ID=MMETSP0208-20121228/7761_1 /TAXON_ID=197538 /ORGANISM="Strombidium inclinatum, Strain S3" /LENGTH=204 /DNA_ID=CAMNT_0010764311 /DNA_START=42 /DNA_END=656 /DNA_ORIENTATION=+